MSNPLNDPTLAPTADSPAQKIEKVRAGKGVAGILGAIAVVFVVVFAGIIGYALIFGLTQ